tara:strand:+ start:1077 stop:1685 length:609 start_codon:yes stop_codon:yes gene_type:complete
MTNKIIISKLILLILENQIDKKIIVNDFDIYYKKKEISLKKIIISEKNNSNKDIFLADEILVRLDPKTLLSKLIIIENIIIQKPTLNLEFNILENGEKLIEDNLGVSKNFERKENPKIYPKKIIDINFIVLNSTVEKFNVNIKRSDNKNIEKIILSNMYFKNFGNEHGYTHYKNILKIVLVDLILKITDHKLKKLIKKQYNF